MFKMCKFTKRQVCTYSKARIHLDIKQLGGKQQNLPFSLSKWWPRILRLYFIINEKGFEKCWDQNHN